MNNRLLVLNVVGLSPKHIGERTPNLNRLAERGCRSHIQPMLPAVTCPVQTTYFTGKLPAEHGVVANGWYMRELSEIKFWHQSNHLIQSEQIWTALKQRDALATSANIFCWFNMYCPADTAITVRPMYPADGRKIPDIYTSPTALREELNAALGAFPLFNFWGPNSSIVSSQWLANATLKILEERKPDLAVAYLPHLDYSMQKLGPKDKSIDQELNAIDAVCGQLVDFAQANNYAVVVLSEYGIQEVDQVCYLNRLFRRQGWLAVREELGLELLDAGASQVFAVTDHQIAHIYITNPELVTKVKLLLEQQPEIEAILDDESKRRSGLDHVRSGELIAVAEANAWFSYYYWQDDNKAPDFARTVDIHRKPGYDPVELFLDPAIKIPILKIAGKLLQKKLGLRTLMDLIPLDASLVRGSHGALNKDKEKGAVYVCSETGVLSQEQKENGLRAVDIKENLLQIVRPV